MQFDILPIWASAIGVLSGGDPEGEPAGATITGPPAEKPEAEKPINVNPDDHAKVIRERDEKDAQLLALQQENQEREEAEEAAKAATRSKEENLEKENGTLREDVQKLTLVNTENLLELAILKNSKYDWQNSTTVVKLIDRSEIKIDAKTGKVDGVDKALANLAKENPFLLKTGEGNGEGNNGGNTGLPSQASGGTTSSSQDVNAKAKKRAALIGRFGNVLTP